MTTHHQGSAMIVFDREYLIRNQPVLQNLCDVYCNIWERDEHFGEYRQCPSCRRYYSHTDVEIDGIFECSTCRVRLVKAWLSVSVALDLMRMAEHHSFSGVLLLHEGNVVGFSWGRLYSIEEMKHRWGTSFDSLKRLNEDELYCFYLHELALSVDWRGRGIGKRLARKVLQKPYCCYPGVLGALSTHQDSSSVFIYRRLGFEKIDDNPAGQGRIRMGIGRIALVNMFN